MREKPGDHPERITRAAPGASRLRFPRHMPSGNTDVAEIQLDNEPGHAQCAANVSCAKHERSGLAQGVASYRVLNENLPHSIEEWRNSGDRLSESIDSRGPRQRRATPTH